MKNLICLFIILWMTVRVCAEPDKPEIFNSRNFVVGGNFWVTSWLEPSATYFSVQGSFNGGYYPVDRLELNLGLGYYFSYRFQEGSPSASYNHSFSIRPRIAYYFGRKTWFPYVGIGGSLSVNWAYGIINHKRVGNSITFDGMPYLQTGVLFQVKDFLYLNLSCVYSLYQDFPPDLKHLDWNRLTHQFGLSIGLTRYFIGRKD